LKRGGIVRKRHAVGIVLAFLPAPVVLVAQDPPAWRLARDLRIDAVEHDLSPIGWTSVAPNGTIAFSQPQDGLVRYFDASGRPLGSFGRKGRGPGEFEQLARGGWLADSLWVSDFSTRRFTVIGPDRTLARTVPWITTLAFPGVPPGDEPRTTAAAARAILTRNVQILQVSLAEGGTWPGGRRSGDATVRATSAGTFERVLAWRPEVDCVFSRPFTLDGRSGVVSTIVPFCASPIDDISAEGSRIVATEVLAARDRRGRYRVSAFRTSGDTLWSRVLDYDVTSIPASVLDSVIKQRAGRGGPGAAAALREKTPRVFPPLLRVLAGRDQSTWLEQYSVNGQRTWVVLDAGGNAAGTVLVPRSLRILVASLDAVWASETDEDGLQHVVRYRISR
jgi:hypothetical protein